MLKNLLHQKDYMLSKQTRNYIHFLLVIGCCCFSLFIAKAQPRSQSFDSLISDLQHGLGTQKLITIEKISEYYNIVFIKPLIEALNERDGKEVTQAIAKELVKYGTVAEDDLIEHLSHSEQDFTRSVLIEILCNIKSTKAVKSFLEILATSENQKIQQSIRQCLLVLGDSCTSSLVSALQDKATREIAQLCLFNMISDQALISELGKLGDQLTEDEMSTLNQLPPQKRVEALVTRIVDLIDGQKRAHIIQPETTKKQAFDFKSFLRDQITVNPNPFFISALVLSGILLIFIFTQIIYPQIFPARSFNKHIARIEKAITEKRWKDALDIANSINPSNSRDANAEEYSRALRAKILRAKAEDELENNRFENALKDFEAFCHLSNKEDKFFREKVIGRKVEYTLEQGWDNYCRRALEESRKHFVSVMRDDFNNWEAHFGLGLINFEEGQYNEAVREFQAAQSNSKTTVYDIQLFIALSMSRLGENGTALDLLEDTNSQNISKLGMFYFGKLAVNSEGNYETGASILEKLIQGEASIPLWGRGSFIAQLQEKYHFVDRITYEDCSNLLGATHWLLGQAYLKIGYEAEKAEDEFQKARALGYVK